MFSVNIQSQKKFLQTVEHGDRSKRNNYQKNSTISSNSQDFKDQAKVSPKNVLDDRTKVLINSQKRNQFNIQNFSSSVQNASKSNLQTNNQKRMLKSSFLIRNDIENSKNLLNELKNKHCMLLTERPAYNRQIAKEKSLNSTKSNSQRSLNQKLQNQKKKLDSKNNQESMQTFPKQLSIQDFDIINFCGQGALGSVYIARHLKSNSIYALKKIQKQNISTQKDKQSLVRQIKIHIKLNHPNIVRFYGFFSDEKAIYLVLEFCCSGNLHEILRKYGAFSQKDTKSIIRQICNALNYLHSNNIIHRDIKAKNIVIQEKTVKLCDFGRAIEGQFKRKSFGGTPAYISPEIIQNKLYDKKVDVWSMGILTFELIYGTIPFDIRSSADLAKIMKNDICLPSKKAISEACRDFIMKCLQKDSKIRWSTSDLLNHPFLTGP